MNWDNHSTKTEKRDKILSKTVTHIILSHFYALIIIEFSVLLKSWIFAKNLNFRNKLFGININTMPLNNECHVDC